MRALDGVRFSVPHGAIKSLIGPNGAGKTTLLNVLTGVSPPDEGRVWLGGTQVTGLPSHRVVALGMARTFQNVRLFGNMTTLENVMVGRHVRSHAEFMQSILKLPNVWREERSIGTRARGLLELVGLVHQAERQARELSFAEERRLEIARALATDPKVLLLDEPAAGLNQKEADSLAELLRNVRATGVTLLLVEHNVRMVMSISDEVIVLNFGRLIADSTPEAVARDPAVIRAYLGERESETAGASAS